MLLEHRAASVLLSADAFPTVLVPALAVLAKRRGIAGPAPIDAVKLSHHGSRVNVTRDLLQAVDSRRAAGRVGPGTRTRGHQGTGLRHTLASQGCCSSGNPVGR